jgi:hypothetical protein
MPLLTQYRSFFVSPFGEASVCDELNAFLKSHRIVNVEKRLVDGERGTGWLFLVEYGAYGDLKAAYIYSDALRLLYAGRVLHLLNNSPHRAALLRRCVRRPKGRPNLPPYVTLTVRPALITSFGSTPSHRAAPSPQRRT